MLLADLPTLTTRTPAPDEKKAENVHQVLSKTKQSPKESGQVEVDSFQNKAKRKAFSAWL